MELIPEEIMEETWQEVAGFTPPHVYEEMSKMCARQPDLLSFTMEFTQDLKKDVQELAVYMFFVVYRMFEKSYENEINKIPAEEIILCWEHNETLIERLEGVHDKFFDRIARVQISKQPYVMKYVTETLIEEPDKDEALSLTEEDTGYLFLILKTIVDVLDKNT